MLLAVDEPEFNSEILYTTVTGFFMQDDPQTDPGSFDYAARNFGLITRPYDTDAEYDPDHNKTQWQRFEHQVFHLNRECEKNVEYKVLYMGRHGEGVHNVAEVYYGTQAWDEYWSKLDGNDTVTWVDAHLTSAGEAQAQIAHQFWKKQIKDERIPVPQSFYVSPLFRCLATAQITFDGLDPPCRGSFNPQVKELIREAIGIHTCDRRSSRTHIHESFPSYRIETGFKENDELWMPDIRETNADQDVRLKKLLDDVFRHDDSTYVSFTSHSGAIAAILRTIGHQDFPLLTGAIIPVLVKAETIKENPHVPGVA
ncbi:MAG: hypothetical protein M1837_000157 [Sclerophora amabilis]|nr:MAG: hypothetical protein M1837_000157 [Sclerophora amabilis]